MTWPKWNCPFSPSPWTTSSLSPTNCFPPSPYEMSISPPGSPAPWYQLPNFHPTILHAQSPSSSRIGHWVWHPSFPGVSHRIQWSSLPGVGHRIRQPPSLELATDSAASQPPSPSELTFDANSESEVAHGVLSKLFGIIFINGQDRASHTNVTGRGQVILVESSSWGKSHLVKFLLLSL